MTNLDKYLEKYSDEFSEVMSGQYILGVEELENILKTALEKDKKFVIVEQKEGFIDGQSYKLV